MKVLVTGGAGYLGSVLVEFLLKKGFYVTVLDNFMFRQPSLLHLCNYDNLEIVKGDAREADVIKRLIKDKDIIIPLAALVGVALCERDRTGAYTVNYEAVKMLCELSSKDQIIIYPNTNSGYGRTTGDVFCTEETPLSPVSWYGKTKVDAEKVVMDRGNAVSFRLATVFGVSPRMRLDLLVNNFVYRAVRERVIVVFEGHFKRNFIHVRDVARAFIHAIENFDVMKDNVYNVGLDEANMSKLELARFIKNFVPDMVVIEEPIGKDPDQRNYIVSNEKIKRTGYLPEYSLDYGIRELIKAYNAISEWDPIYTNGY